MISGGGVDAFEVGVCGFSYFGTVEFCVGKGEMGTERELRLDSRKLSNN